MSHVRLRNTKIYTVWLYLSLTKHQPGLSHTPEQPPQLSHLHMRQAQFPVGRASVDLSYVGGGGGGDPKLHWINDQNYAVGDGVLTFELIIKVSLGFFDCCSSGLHFYCFGELRTYSTPATHKQKRIQNMRFLTATSGSIISSSTPSIKGWLVIAVVTTPTTPFDAAKCWTKVKVSGDWLLPSDTASMWLLDVFQKWISGPVSLLGAPRG